MTTQELSPELPSYSNADVEDSRSTSCWTVQDRGWKQDQPDLPDDVIALLAPPVVVRAAIWVAPAALAGPQLATGAVAVDGQLAQVAQFPSPSSPARVARRRTAGRIVPRATARIA